MHMREQLNVRRLMMSGEEETKIATTENEKKKRECAGRHKTTSGKHCRWQIQRILPGSS